jgi:hypothetical protein
MKKLCLLVLLTLPISAQQLIFPQAPPTATAVFFGTTGSTAYYYWVVANYPWGASIPGGPAVVANGNATLSALNVINVSWASMTAATSYDLLRTASSTPPTSGCNCALIIRTASTSYNDTGIGFLAYTVASPGVIFPDASAQTTAAGGTTGGPTVIQLAQINDTGNNLAVEKLTGTASAVNEVTLSNAATGNSPAVSATGSDTDIDLTITPKGAGAVKIAGVVRTADLTITTANLNAATSNTIVAAVTGRTLQVVGFFLQALGGNTATCTDVRISDTAGSPVDVVVEGIAGLVQNQGITESSAVANLTFGAGWSTTLTASKGIQIRKTGGACATATSFYVRVYYRIA